MIETNPLETETAQTAETYLFPCTIAQRTCWYVDRMSPGTPANNIAVRFLMEGPLDPSRCERTFRHIAERHEILRTRFVEQGGEPRQLIEANTSFRLAVVDLRPLSSHERAEASESLAVKEAQTGFDLSNGPLFRGTLVQTGDETFVLLVTMHHIISDGWSIGILTNEFGEVYESFATSQFPAAPDLTLQYADYACWQENWLTSSELDGQLARLTRKFDGFQPLSIPTDFERPATASARGEIRSILLPRPLTDSLKRFSDQNSCTLFVTMFSALLVLLNKESNQTCLTVRTQTSGRHQVELEGLIGWFVNSQMLRVDLNGKTTFLDVVLGAQQEVLESLSYQQVPFERAMEVVRPRFESLRQPPFQVNFIFQRDFVRPWTRAGIRFTPIPSKAAGTFVDLNIFLVERDDGWRASVDVSTDVFRPETGVRILQSFQKVLESVAADPLQRLCDIPYPPIPRRHLDAQNPSCAPFLAPRSEVENKIAAIWEDVLRIRPIGVQTNFFDVGGHSLLAVPVLVRLKDQFGLSIPLAQLFARPTIEAMARVIEMGERAAPMKIVPIQPEGSRHPFFMIGGDHWFRPLAKRLGPDQPFLGISLQRYEERSEPTPFHEIGGDLARLLVDEFPSGPYLLGGWCVDGCVAYEVAQQLVAMGKDVKLVALMDAINPPYRRFFRSNRLAVGRILRRTIDLVRDARQLHGKDAGRCLLDGLVDIFRRIQRALLPSLTKIEQDQVIVQNDPDRQEFRKLLYRSEDQYSPDPTRVPLLLIRSKIDRYQDSDLGWSEVALGGMETVEVSGDHIGMFREPQVESLASVLWQRLSRLS